MDLGSIIPLVLIGLVIAAVGIFTGFMFPAPTHKVESDLTEEPRRVPLPGDFSPALRKFLSDHSEGQALAPTRVAAWGRGRIASRIPFLGRVWLPLSWNLYLVPGSMFVIHNRIIWYRRTFIHGGEEYRQGKGAFLLGKRPVDNPYLDETERSLVWLYSIWLAPGSLVNHPAVKWELSENTAHLSVREEGLQPLDYELVFEPGTGTLIKISGTRKGSRTGGDYPFEATLLEPKNFDGIGDIPTRWIANWDNDVYLKLNLTGINLNVDIDPIMQTGIEDLTA